MVYAAEGIDLGMHADDRASFNPVDVSLGGWHLAQLSIGVLGVLFISGEYSTGQIRSTFAAVPPTSLSTRYQIAPWMPEFPIGANTLLQAGR